LKSFVQDYSHAGYACLEAFEDFVCEKIDLINIGGEKKKEDDAIKNSLTGAFPFVVMALYSELELLDYEAICEWKEEVNSDEDKTSSRSVLYNTPLLQRVLNGIKAQEEGSDSESENSGSSSSSGSDDDDNCS
jgi:hypothetical protein